MTVDERRAALYEAVRELWLAVAELVLTTNDDQPEPNVLAPAEDVAQSAVEIQGRLAEALGALSSGAPDSVRDALHDVSVVERTVREAHLIYWRDLRAHRPVAQVRSSTRRRQGEWPSWWFGVEQSLQRCEKPFEGAGEAIGAALHELATPPQPDTTSTQIPRRSS